MKHRVSEAFTVLVVLLYTKLIDRLSMSYIEIVMSAAGWLLGAFIYEAAKNYFKMIRRENSLKD